MASLVGRGRQGTYLHSMGTWCLSPPFCLFFFLSWPSTGCTRFVPPGGLPTSPGSGLVLNILNMKKIETTAVDQLSDKDFTEVSCSPVQHLCPEAPLGDVLGLGAHQPAEQPLRCHCCFTKSC